MWFERIYANVIWKDFLRSQYMYSKIKKILIYKRVNSTKEKRHSRWSTENNKDYIKIYMIDKMKDKQMKENEFMGW